ncbi:MAG: hypothetical protein V4486_00355 [Patescibacteria group bacterium]
MESAAQALVNGSARINREAAESNLVLGIVISFLREMNHTLFMGNIVPQKGRECAFISEKWKWSITLSYGGGWTPGSFTITLVKQNLPQIVKFRYSSKEDRSSVDAANALQVREALDVLLKGMFVEFPEVTAKWRPFLEAGGYLCDET